MSAEAQARSSRQAARAASTMAAAADGDGLLAQKRAKDEENARRQAAIAAEFPDESPAVLLDPGFASDLDSDTDSDIDGEAPGDSMLGGSVAISGDGKMIIIGEFRIVKIIT